MAAATAAVTIIQITI